MNRQWEGSYGRTVAPEQFREQLCCHFLAAWPHFCELEEGSVQYDLPVSVMNQESSMAHEVECSALLYENGNDLPHWRRTQNNKTRSETRIEKRLLSRHHTTRHRHLSLDDGGEHFCSGIAYHERTR